MVRVIAIEREYGCGAAQIAATLAARLARCKQSAVEEREERRDPLYRRLMRSFALGSYEGNLGVYPVETLDADSIFRISKRVVEEAAASGNCVIVGRGSQHFLQNHADTLRFFLYAPRENKVRRLVSEGHKESEANVLVDTVDHERAAFIKNYFHANWPNRPVYHAMLNTATGDETVIQVMLTFLRQREQQVPASRLQPTADTA